MDRVRSRSRSMDGRWSSIIEVPPPGSGWNASGLYRTVVAQSSITDNPHGMGALNGVHHIKYDYTDMNIVLPRSQHVSKTNHATAVYSGYVFARGDRAPGPVVPPIDYTDAVNDLIADALGVMPTQVNLLVNAAEFAQLKTLVPGLLQGIGSIFTWGVRQKLGRKSFRDVAGSHLAYSFGLSPLISDFRSLFSIRSKVKSRMKQLLDRNGKPVRISKATSVSETSSSYAVLYGNSPDTRFTETGEWQISTQGFVSAKVSSFFTGSSEAQAKLWASALGLSTPLQTMWEIIPFSFVVDWFVPVGKTFQALENKLGINTTVMCCDISDWLTSSKIECKRNGTMACVSDNYPGWNLGNVGSCSKSIKAYARGRGIPPTKLISAPSGWTMNKSALSISLLAQKIIK